VDGGKLVSLEQYYAMSASIVNNALVFMYVLYNNHSLILLAWSSHSQVVNIVKLLDRTW